MNTNFGDWVCSCIFLIPFFTIWLSGLKLALFRKYDQLWRKIRHFFPNEEDNGELDHCVDRDRKSIYFSIEWIDGIKSNGDDSRRIRIKSGNIRTGSNGSGMEIFLEYMFRGKHVFVDLWQSQHYLHDLVWVTRLKMLLSKYFKFLLLITSFRQCRGNIISRFSKDLLVEIQAVNAVDYNFLIASM